MVRGLRPRQVSVSDSLNRQIGTLTRGELLPHLGLGVDDGFRLDVVRLPGFVDAITHLGRPLRIETNLFGMGCQFCGCRPIR